MRRRPALEIILARPHDRRVSAPAKSSPPLPSLATVTRRVVAGQMLFTTGHVLSTGGFLYYFANEFRPSAALFALLQVVPEIAEAAGLLVRPLLALFGGRKRTWIILLLAGRTAALGVPAMAFPELRPPGVDPFLVIVACVACWYVCQGLSYVAYLSWLSDLAPERRWGRFFATRQLASLAVMLVVPTAASVLRGRWINTLPEDARLHSFVLIFVLGGMLAASSIIPLLSLPNVAAPTFVRRLPSLRVLRAAVGNRSFRLLLAQSWWLSFAQGLSQAALFKFQVEVLKIPLETYYVLSGLMLLLQLPVTMLAGRLSDRYGDRQPLMAALFAVAPALLFWIAATPERWWLLFGAYALWGLFGMVNVCGQNLALRLAPASDNTLHLGLFRQIGGLLAGLAGFCGGLWLDALLSEPAGVTIAGLMLGPYQVVFLVSFLGRITAPLWLIGVCEPRTDRGATAAS